MATEGPEPAWLVALHLVLTVVTVAVAVPALLDGDWVLAVAAVVVSLVVVLLVVELPIVVLVQRAQRRRRECSSEIWPAQRDAPVRWG